MNVVIPHESVMVLSSSLAELNPQSQSSSSGFQASRIWVNSGLTSQERDNVALIGRFWTCWKTLPFDVEELGGFFADNVTVRTGWRGEHVITGRTEALAMYADEARRQADHGETTDFRFPVVVAKGPTVFHTWVWIAHSERLGYHIERPMASSYLITDRVIERWDSYCTGPESEPGYVGGDGPDGL